MSLAELIRTSVRGVSANTLRAALTMLGIIIGVASVVALMAIGNGAKQDVLERIQAMGTDLLTIMRGPPAVRASANLVTSFVPEDLSLVKGEPDLRRRAQRQAAHVQGRCRSENSLSNHIRLQESPQMVASPLART